MQLLLAQESLEGFAGCWKPFMICTIQHKDQGIATLVVVPPEVSELLLAAHVPNAQAEVAVLDCFHIEADGRDGRENLSNLQLVQDGSLASCIQAQHQDIDLLGAPYQLPESTEREAHTT
eukprot:CAMPEP_0181449270 /NCGR_PEP_ID=MMETSP1110-20121109/27570_1 /TAXON_ID=174948 /ORGANISM="Symbiodinium sp., Strain CCMP421" /LENGTH=119 /DNA_ID=CAMNT_0023573447 /DNA_START=310 /DNA_END=669 /DNA_ORIENTATION=-